MLGLFGAVVFVWECVLISHLLMFAGAKNHQFFMGYLIMLLAMCIFMLYGCVLFWQTMCGTSLGKGFWRGEF
jgi:hypothetical protein